MVYISSIMQLQIPEIRNYEQDGGEYTVAGISARELLENGKTDNIHEFYGGSSENEILDFFANKWVPWGLYQTSYALSESLPTENKTLDDLMNGGNRNDDDDDSNFECTKDDKYEKCLERISLGFNTVESKKTIKRGENVKSNRKKTRKSKTR